MRTTVLTIAVGALLVAHGAAAQQFQPPKKRGARRTPSGCFGFGVRGGVDFRKSGQFVMEATLDLGDLLTNRIRLRPSAEVGVFNGPNTYVGNFEALWRFTTTRRWQTPYIGLGLAWRAAKVAAPIRHARAVVKHRFGFELHYRSTFNWLPSITAWTGCAGTGCTSD